MAAARGKIENIGLVGHVNSFLSSDGSVTIRSAYNGCRTVFKQSPLKSARVLGGLVFMCVYERAPGFWRLFVPCVRGMEPQAMAAIMHPRDTGFFMNKVQVAAAGDAKLLVGTFDIKRINAALLDARKDAKADSTMKLRVDFIGGIPFIFETSINSYKTDTREDMSRYPDATTIEEKMGEFGHSGEMSGLMDGFSENQVNPVTKKAERAIPLASLFAFYFNQAAILNAGLVKEAYDLLREHCPAFAPDEKTIASYLQSRPGDAAAVAKQRYSASPSAAPPADVPANSAAAAALHLKRT